MNATDRLIKAAQGMVSEYENPVPDWAMKQHWIREMKAALKDIPLSHGGE